MPLGFEPSLLLNNPVDREFRESMSKGIQAIGTQVTEGIKRIATNRQTKDMLEELQQTNPDSQMFPQQAVGLLQRYPIAATDKRGLAALSMYDKEHQRWEQQQSALNTQLMRPPTQRTSADGTTRQEWDATSRTWVDAGKLPPKRTYRTGANGEILAIEDTPGSTEPTISTLRPAQTKYGIHGGGIYEETPGQPPKMIDKVEPIQRSGTTDQQRKIRGLESLRPRLVTQYNNALNQAIKADLAANDPDLVKAGQGDQMDPNSTAGKLRQFAQEKARLAAQAKSELEKADLEIGREKQMAGEPIIPGADKVYQTEEEARADGRQIGEIIIVINPRTGKPSRARLD